MGVCIVNGRDILKLGQGKSSKKFPFSFAILSIFIIVSLVACVELPTTAKVTKVIDGDTIEVEGEFRVRYIGVDTPEKGEPYYTEALQANQKLVEGKEVRLERDVSNTDKYGRLLRYVYVGDTFVNAELVTQGYARVHAYPPDTKYQIYLQVAEIEAQQNNKGIWQQK